MRTDRLKEVLTCVCLVLCVFSFMLPLSEFESLAQAPPATVAVSPPSIAATVGQDFSVDINISSVSDLYGWEFKLGWNASLLDLVSVNEGPFLRSGGNTFFYPNTTEEYIVVLCTLEGPIPGVNGSGTLATVTFNPTNAGECPLNLYNVTLVDSNDEPISCSVIGGYVTNVTNVIPRKTVIFQGYDLNFNVTIEDPSNSAETFNVTAYANMTYIATYNASQNVISYLPVTHINTTAIATQTVTLNSGDPETLTFTWNTGGFAKGKYMISTYALLVVGGTNLTNSTFIYGSVYVSMVSDLTGTTLFVPDGKVDGRDITVVAKCFASELGDSNYNPNCDIFNRGKVDGRDVTVVAKNFGKTDP